MSTYQKRAIYFVCDFHTLRQCLYMQQVEFGIEAPVVLNQGRRAIKAECQFQIAAGLAPGKGNIATADTTRFVAANQVLYVICILFASLTGGY